MLYNAEMNGMISNPHGANATQSDPREQLCWDLYVESINKGKTNAYAAAIKAGYTRSNAVQVTTREWFKERLQRLKRKDMFSKAENVLEKTLSYKTDINGEDVQVDLLKVQVDAAKHLTSKLGKAAGYEGGESGGNIIFILPTELIEKNKAPVGVPNQTI